MNICLICEGSYPYVIGGVSSWANMLIGELKDYDFQLYTISVNEEMQGKLKYEMYPNVKKITNSFLEGNLEKSKKNKRIKPKVKQAMVSLLSEEIVDWPTLFEFFETHPKLDVRAFLMGEDFYDVVVISYKKSQLKIVFADYLWTLRSMYLPLFNMMIEPIDEADKYHTLSTGYAGIKGCMAKYKYHKPLILSEHGIYTREREEEIIKADWIKGIYKNMWIKHFTKLSKCCYDYADNIVSLFGISQQIQHELGADKNKTIIIPNGVRFDDLQNLSEDFLDRSTINVGALIRMVPIKDIKTMIISFHLTKQKVPNAKFYIMGTLDVDREYADECKSLVDMLGEKDIIFTGQIDINKYIGSMDILVLSSLSEGQPLAILEGMAVGKPWVSTDVGSCRELLYGMEGDDLGQAGYVVTVMDSDDMSKKIVKLCHDKKLRETMGSIGKDRVDKYYRNEQFLNEYRKLYELI
jgi:glycosyltransferase involved in cell wall biosynthesis